MAATTEGEFATRDGTKLYTKTWKPASDAARAVLIFLHGFSDHINAYYDLFPTLSSSPFNIAVYGFDQRGWGRSCKKAADNGHTGPTSLVISDVHDFALHVASLPEAQGKPLFLMGHSMGGGEALTYMLSASPDFSNRPAISGLLLESPYIEMHSSGQPSSMKVQAGKLASMLLPRMQLKQKLDATYMSRSEKVRQDWIDDPLCHDTGTLEGLKGLLQRSADLSHLSHGRPIHGFSTKLPCPLWISFGTGDRVLSHIAAQQLFNVVEAPNKDKTFKLYPDAYHKLHAEPDGVGEQFAKDAGEWILVHVTKQAEVAQVGETQSSQEVVSGS
ncbi:putative lysophospholipase [Cladophialophora carrionii]|uniref:Putative lysophospholipase n=1 Tax=Cladophialophora carrionii TaxID=86049 RepID=A0A1C1CK30_9EURO|nr:putative lysophospholipase [Cladophialophora carrionii]